MHYTAGKVFRTVQGKAQSVYSLALWRLWRSHWV